MSIITQVYRTERFVTKVVYYFIFTMLIFEKFGNKVTDYSINKQLGCGLIQRRSIRLVMIWEHGYRWGGFILDLWRQWTYLCGPSSGGFCAYGYFGHLKAANIESKIKSYILLLMSSPTILGRFWRSRWSWGGIIFSLSLWFLPSMKSTKQDYSVLKIQKWSYLVQVSTATLW